MKAMILAAGKGTRLGMLGQCVPKILVPVGGVPLIQHTFAWLKSHGITRVALNVNHLSDKVIEWVGDGCRFGMEVAYSREDTLLGTAGGVKKMEHFFDGTFVVVYGDILTDFDLTAMIRFHKEKKAVATLALFEAPNPREVGIVEIDEAGRILTFVEKPQSPVPSPQSLIPSPQLASAAVYVLEKEVLDYIPEKSHCDFGYDVFPKLLAAGLPVYGYVLGSGDYWLDIGTPEKYRQADEDVKAGRLNVPCPVSSFLPGNG